MAFTELQSFADLSPTQRLQITFGRPYRLSNLAVPATTEARAVISLEPESPWFASSKETPLLRDDVVNWCLDNLEFKWCLIKTVKFHNPDKAYQISNRYFLEFLSDTDAIHFKLFWL